MPSNRYVSTAFWTDPWIERLQPAGKLLFLYLLSNPQTNVAGVYEITLARVAYETGIELDTVKELLVQFEADGKAKYLDGWMVVTNFIKHQNAESPKIQEGIRRILSVVPASVLPSVGYGMDTVGETPYKYKSRSKSKSSYGESVLLADEEYAELKAGLGEKALREYIGKVNDYCASKGKAYKDYAATIRTWARKDNKWRDKQADKATVTCPVCAAVPAGTEGYCLRCGLERSSWKDTEAVADARMRWQKEKEA